MTRATKAKYYSAQFFDLADALSKNPEKAIELEFPTPKEAKSFRLEFYSFRACAEREGMSEQFPELCALTVHTQGNKVTVMHKDYTPNALVLKKALEESK